MKHAVVLCQVSLLVVLLANPVSSQPPPLGFQRTFGGTGSGSGTFQNPFGVAVASDGSVYVTDETLHIVQKFTADGVFMLQWGGNGTAVGEFRRPQGVAVDSNGDVYVCDRDNNRVQKFTSGGSFVLEWGTNGTAPGEFRRPQGVAVDDLNNVYVTDQDNDRVQKFTSSGVFVLEWGGSGSDPGQFDTPSAIAVDMTRIVYVADRQTGRVQIFDDSGVYQAEITHGSGLLEDPLGLAVDGVFLYVGDDNRNLVDVFDVSSWSFLFSIETIDRPTGVAAGGPGYLYVTSLGENRVLRFGPSVYHDPWTNWTPWGSFGTGPGEFRAPVATAGGMDTLWVTDSENHRVQRFISPGHIYDGEFGTNGTGIGQFRFPHGILRKGSELFVADRDNDRIQVFALDGTWLRNIGSGGGGPGQLDRPYGIAIDAGGDLLVADGNNDRIQKFSTAGAFLSLWGTTGTGPGQFRSPHGIGVGPSGTIYVTDSQNDRIQFFSAAGAYLGEWGTLGNGYGQFDTPLGLGVDDNGWVFVADSRNARVIVFDDDGDQIEEMELVDPLVEPHGVQVSEDGYLYIVDETGVLIHPVDIRNDPPVARPDSTCLYLGEQTSMNVIDNDEDPDSDALWILEVLTAGTRGQVTYYSQSIDYTAPLAGAGPDSFQYVVSDGYAHVDTAWVWIDVGTFPVAVNDNPSVPEDTPTVLLVLANDSDADGDSIYVAWYNTDGLLGQLIPQGSGITSFLYTPPPDYHGPDSFTYGIHDGHCAFDPMTAVAAVTIDVTPVNDPPVAVDDAATTPRDVSVTVHVLANDTDVDDDPLTVAELIHPAPDGNAVIDVGDTTVTFTPDPGFTGIDSLLYVAADGAGARDTALVAITVNTFPVAVNDTFLVVEDTPTVLNVRANDTDDDGDPLSIVAVDDAGTLGSVTFNASNVTYTPPSNYNGADQFGYTISDGNGGEDDAVVYVTVTPVNDSPVAEDDAFGALEDTPLSVNVVANDTDVDHDPLQVTQILQNGSIGAGVPDGEDVLYTPQPDSCGVDSLLCRISDGQGGEDTSWLVITVACVQDVPVAVDDTLLVPKNVSTSLAVLANDYDVDGEGLTVVSVDIPLHGSAAIAPDGLSIDYVPDPDYLGPDMFGYCVSDGLDLDCAVVYLGVGQPDPANSKACILACPEGDFPSEIEILDADGLPITGAQVTIELTSSILDSLFVCAYSDTVYTTVTDAFGLAAPSLDKGGATYGGVRVLVDWGVGAQELFASVPLKGVDINANGIVDGPDSAFATPYFLNSTYHVLLDYDCDGNVGLPESSLFTTHLMGHHNCASLPPDAVDDVATTPEDTPVVIPVLANDTEPDGEPIEVTDLDLTGTLGAVVIDAGGQSVTYTPPADYFGPDAFVYEAGDPTRGRATANVNVTVTPVNDAPVAAVDSVCVASGVSTTLSPLGNDQDVEDDPLTLSALDLTGTVGTASIDPGDTTLSYQSPPGYGGWTSLDYTVDDGAGGFDVGQIHILVDRPPNAVDDIAMTPEDTPVLIEVLVNDSDPDGEPLRIVSAGPAAFGQVAIEEGDSTLAYDPDPDYHGADAFTYVVQGTGCTTDTATVSLTVTPVNDAPVAHADTLLVDEDTMGIIDLLANDIDVDADSIWVASIDTVGIAGSIVWAAPGGEIEYSPPPDYHDSTGFSYVIDDGNGGSDGATVLIVVAPVNDCPVGVPDFVTTPEDVPVVIPIVANDTDVDGEPLVVDRLLLNVGVLGTVVVDPGALSVTYTPKMDYVGVDVFRYVVRDPTGCKDTTFAQVKTTLVDDPATAVDDYVGTLINTTVGFEPGANDYDPEGGVLTIVSVDQPLLGLGSTTLHPDGITVLFTPIPDTTGTDSFLYEVSDGVNPPSTATVFVSITARPDPETSSHCLVLYPDGSSPITVTVTDSLGAPITGAEVTVDMAAATAADSILFCDPLEDGVLIARTDPSGTAEFPQGGGGYARWGAEVTVRMQGLETGDLVVSLGDSLLVTSVDLTGDLLVDSGDEIAFINAFIILDPIGDLDCNGFVSAADQQVLLAAIGIACSGQVGLPDEPISVSGLYTPFPNPFRGSTVMLFECDREMPVRLEIYDLRGRCVATPLDCRMPKGRHLAAWDGRGSSGKELSSGIYFMNLRCGRVSMNRKVVLMR